MNKNCAKCRVRGYICQGCEEAAAMNTNKIAVLAVMDEANSALHNTCSVMGENRWTEERLAEARGAVVRLIAAAEALSPKYSDMTTVRGRQLMTRKLRTLEAALLGVGGAQ